VVPLRLRGAAVLGVGVAGGAAISAWALPSHALSDDNVALHLRTDPGHTFGLVLVIAILLTTAVAAVLAARMDGPPMAPDRRRRVGTALLIVVALIPVVGVVDLAGSSRGFTGEISHLWGTLTNPNGGAGNQPGRLLTLSNNRTRYWGEGLTVGEHHLALGAGAGGFAVAHERYTKSQFPISHAHNYLIETFADLGLLGVLISLALLFAWAVSAGRALGVVWDPTSRLKLRVSAAGERAQERDALLTILVVVVIFGLHSLIDWTWFIPGCAVVGLVCAGWLAGRGPLEAPVGRLSVPRRPARYPVVGMAIVLIGALVVGAAWTTVQPLRATDADSAAIGALLRGDSSSALTDARRAVAANPLALDPLFDLSVIYSARGQATSARAELLKAVSLQPENSISWQTLGNYDLQQHRPKLALAELNHALSLYPWSVEIPPLIAAAHAQGG
jgi:hypothetical protein